MSDPEQRKWKSNKIGMTFPFTFKVGQFMTGIGFGCGIGLGFGSPINFGRERNLMLLLYDSIMK